MSILQEYENIRNEIGLKMHHAIEMYLQEVTPDENYNKYNEELTKLALSPSLKADEFNKYDKQLKEKYGIVLLSDIYYTEEGWSKFEEWYKKNGGEIV